MASVEQQPGEPLTVSPSIATSSSGGTAFARQESSATVCANMSLEQQRRQLHPRQQQLIIQPDGSNSAAGTPLQQQLFPENFIELMKDVAPNVSLTEPVDNQQQHQLQTTPRAPPPYGQSTGLSWNSQQQQLVRSSASSTDPTHLPTYNNALFVQPAVSGSSGPGSSGGVSPYDPSPTSNISSPSLKPQHHQPHQHSTYARQAAAPHHPSPPVFYAGNAVNNNATLLDDILSGGGSNHNTATAAGVSPQQLSNVASSSSRAVSQGSPSPTAVAQQLWNHSDSLSVKEGIRQLVSNRTHHQLYVQQQQKQQLLQQQQQPVKQQSESGLRSLLSGETGVPQISEKSQSIQPDEIPADLIEESESFFLLFVFGT